MRAARWSSLVLVLGLLAAPLGADAQRGGPQDRERLEQRIRAQMGRLMQQRLALDEEEAGRLSEVVQSFDGRRRQLARREFETRRQVEALLEADGDQTEALRLLELQIELRVEEAELFREEQEALLSVLSPAQVLELQELRQDIGRRIRNLRGGGRPDSDGVRGRRPDSRQGARPDRRPRAPLG